MHALLLCAVASCSAPQAPPSGRPADLEAMALRVDAAHHPRGQVPPIKALRSTLELHVLDTRAAEGGQVALAVQLLLWQPPGRDRPQPLIRYEVLEAGSPIVRGRDRRGPWQLFQGEAKDLRGAEFGEDLAACQKHTNLARQLVRFLDPAAVLRSLETPTAVRDEDLRIDRNTTIGCQTVEGSLPSFPLLQQGGDDAPVRLKVFVERVSGRLLAVEASPLHDGKAELTRTERVHLLDLYEQDDLLVPRVLEHLFRGDDDRLRLQSRVVFTALSLRPELRAEDFDRPKPK